MTVLLISDKEEQLPYSAQYADKQQYTLHRASDCCEALEMLFLHRYELVIVNVSANDPYHDPLQRFLRFSRIEQIPGPGCGIEAERKLPDPLSR